MLFAQGALGVILLGFMLFCLLDVITSDGSEVRHLPKVAWILLVVLISPVGGLAWLLAGRPLVNDRSASGGTGAPRPPGQGTTRQPRPGPTTQLAPDDDPEFLAELRRREQELRRKRAGDDDSVA